MWLCDVLVPRKGRRPSMLKAVPFWAQSFHHKSSSVCEWSNSLSKKSPLQFKNPQKKNQTNSWGPLFSSKIPTNESPSPTNWGPFALIAWRPKGRRVQPQAHSCITKKIIGLWFGRVPICARFPLALSWSWSHAQIPPNEMQGCIV